MVENNLILPPPPLGSTQRYRVGERHLNVWLSGNNGPVVLLMHGIPTNHMLWRDVVPSLASRARIIAVDLLGYGGSDRPNGQAVDIAAQASYINELMDVLGVQRATVVGHDIGGGVAQILATRYSERVERLGLIDAVCYDGWPVPIMKVLKMASPVIERLPVQPTLALLKPMLQAGFIHQQRAKEFVDYYLKPFSTDDGLKVFVQHLRSLDSKYTQEIAPLLPTLRVPTAIIWGWHDNQMKKEYAQRLAADIPVSELTWVADSHHFVPADAPQAVESALHHLLDRPTIQ